MYKNTARSTLFTAALTTFALIAFTIPALACLWTYGTNIEGKQIEINARDHSGHLNGINPNLIKLQWKQKVAELERQIKPDSDYKLRTDYAAALLHVGEIKKAIEILEDVEKTKPGEYVTAANLGTAYELNGENEKALEWIKLGIERNKDSHYGTEWVHVKILEAKLELAKDPNWLKSHSVLGFDFGKDARPLMPSLPVPDHTGKERTAKESSEAIFYQLGERLQFVSAPDPVVADLLSDLGNMYALNTTVEEAKPVYEMSLKFGPAQVDLVKARHNYVSEIISKYGADSPRQRGLMVAIVIIGGLAALLVILLIRKMRSSPS